MRCKACDRQIPDDALLCPYCGISVLRRLAPPSPRTNSPHGVSAGRQGGVSQWPVIAASTAFLLLSLACCLLALSVNIYYGRTTLIGWWTDYRSARTPAAIATPIEGTPVSPVPTPTLVPAGAPSEGATAILTADPMGIC